MGLKLPFRASMAHFYYYGLTIDNTEDLELYIQLNKWYFDRVDIGVQNQFRNLYKKLKQEGRLKHGVNED